MCTHHGDGTHYHISFQVNSSGHAAGANQCGHVQQGLINRLMVNGVSIHEISTQSADLTKIAF